jgi:hypothetical protein
MKAHGDPLLPEAMKPFRVPVLVHGVADEGASTERDEPCKINQGDPLLEEILKSPSPTTMIERPENNKTSFTPITDKFTITPPLEKK